MGVVTVTNKTKLRIDVKSITRDGETRYYIVDHCGDLWINHKPYRVYGFVPDADSKLFEKASLTPDAALLDHAPLADEYNVLPADTPLYRVNISIGYGDQTKHHTYVCAVEPIFDSRTDRDHDFFTFLSLDGGRHFFRYTDIAYALGERI